MGDFNIQLFLSLVQSDGFNPFNVGSAIFRIPQEKLEDVLDALQIVENGPSHAATNGGASNRDKVRFILTQTFRPGQFFVDCHKIHVTFGISRERVVEVLVDAAVQDFVGMQIFCLKT